MEELKLSIEKLINESPVDEATRHHDKSHILHLVQEDVSEVSASGILHTDKNYRTHRIEEAAIGSIKDRLGRWANTRNDIVLKAKGIVGKQSNSELDIKRRKLTEEVEDAKSKAKDSYMRNNNYADLKANYEGTKRRYEDMRAELGGKPPVASRKLIYVIVILLIGSMELMLNYETFNAKYAPGIATIFTIICALCIALASHFHGLLLKQRLSLFAKFRRKEEKRQVLIIQSFLFILLISILIVITFHRYNFLVANIIDTGGISLAGIENTEESIDGIITTFILMNIAVWIFGIFLSYFAHDSRPDYQESFKHYENAKTKFYKVDNGLKRELERISEDFEEQLKKITNSLASHQTDIKDIANLLDRLAAKEASLIKQASASINNMLEKHHSMLITEFNTKSMSSVKIGPDALSVDEFKLKVVSVDGNFVRHTLSLEVI